MALPFTFAQVNAPPTTPVTPPAEVENGPSQPQPLEPVDPSTLGGLFEQMLATSGYHVISTEQDVTTLYNVATQEILLAADAIVSETVADALRRAMTERGVSVYILTRKDTIELPDSYVQSLQQAGAKVRVAELSSNFAIIDRESALMGAMAAGFPKLSVQQPVASIDPELEPGTDMLEYMYETNEERRQMLQDAMSIISASAPPPRDDGGIEVEVTPIDNAGITPEMYQACQEQLSTSSIAELFTSGSIGDLLGPVNVSNETAQGTMTPVEPGAEGAAPLPDLAENACYEYATPTGLTTLMMEPTFVNELIDGYYQAYEQADDHGG